MVKLVYTSTTSRKRKQPQTKALAAAQQKHAKFLEKHGVTPVGKRGPKLAGVAFPDLSVTKAGVVPTSDNIPVGVTPKTDILTDHKWKQGKGEKPDTLRAIEEKAASVSAGYHKGGLQYTLDKPEDRRKQ